MRQAKCFHLGPSPCSLRQCPCQHNTATVIRQGERNARWSLRNRGWLGYCPWRKISTTAIPCNGQHAHHALSYCHSPVAHSTEDFPMASPIANLVSSSGGSRPQPGGTGCFSALPSAAKAEGTCSPRSFPGQLAANPIFMQAERGPAHKVTDPGQDAPS